MVLRTFTLFFSVNILAWVDVFGMTTLAFGLASQAQAKNTVAFSFLIRETVLLNITKIRHFLRQPAGTMLGQETDAFPFFFFFSFLQKIPLLSAK